MSTNHVHKRRIRHLRNGADHRLVVFSLNQFSRRQNYLFLRRNTQFCSLFRNFRPRHRLTLAQVNSYARQIVHIPGVKFLCPLVILLIDTDLLIRISGQPFLHRIIAQPVDQRRPLVKMESMSRIDHRSRT